MLESTPNRPFCARIDGRHGQGACRPRL